MKYCGSNMAAAQNHGDSEVDSLLLNSSCWSQQQNNADQCLLESGYHKLMLGSPMSDKMMMESSMQDSDPPKPSLDVLDSLLLSSQPINSSLAELKPLPPFTGYTGHLSINGIPGHHYHTIAQRLPEENNNYPQQSGYSEHNIVSSSTCLPDSADKMYADSCLGPDTKLFDNAMSGPDSCSVRMYADSQKELGEYDMSSIEDIAAIIGSAIADTTVPSHVEGEDATGSRDSWMDLDAWIDGACVQQDSKLMPEPEYVLPNSPQSGSTLQTLLTQGYMPLLQNRLTHGPPVKVEAPSSTSYGVDMISTSSPPGSVVSTTDSLMLNGQFIRHHYSLTHGHSSIKPDGLCSPDHILGQNYPHTTTTTPSGPKNKRNRSQKKIPNPQINNNVNFQNSGDLGGLLGKEKPVHRCNICNRGFLNKSNIKVHLRTHTGEKPFRCDVCAKAFRQKAHLIKHQQIHKRIGRD